tara:strand:+ start:20974 stop:22860 length:1887 start_codon:yes stop_codon:yes gene_type:complete
MNRIILVFLIIINSVIAQGSLRGINSELDKLKKELQTDLVEQVDTVQEEISPTSISPVSNSLSDKQPYYFGYDYFSREINFFDNIPTPSNYKLGPGDEVILSTWGEYNSQKKFIINKNGSIFYENLGFISLLNSTLEEAESILQKELSKIYDTINSNDNPTNITLVLGRLKSVNVYFTGEVENPGIHLIHPFSDVFTAIVQSGGIKDNGSLRNIYLLRDNKIISQIDFYSFFISGKNDFSDLKIIDGDVIHIPSIKNRINIVGEVNRPGFYEISKNDEISDLIQYASGFTNFASTSIILETINPIDSRISNDKATSSQNIDFNDKIKLDLSSVNKIDVMKIIPNDSMVEVFGRVKNPGRFSANSTLKEVLDIAGGFNDPIFEQTILKNQIIVLRQTSEQFYGKEFTTSYSSSSSFDLEPNDKIFVYENINYRNSFTFKILGEVIKPGTFSLSKNLTLGEALNLAGGLTEFGSKDAINIVQTFISVDEDGIELKEEIQLGNIDLNVMISDGMVINILPIQNTIKVEGNVYNPGLIAISKNTISMSKAIELAGGFKPYSLKKRSYVLRSNGQIDKANLFRGRTKRVYAGDTVFVPANPDPSDFDITTFIADLSSTLANIAAILILVDNND